MRFVIAVIAIMQSYNEVLMPNRFIVIDLDGTLLDTENIMIQNALSFVNKHNFNVSEDVLRQCVGKSEDEVIELMQKNYVDDKFIQIGTKMFIDYYVDMVLHSDVPVKSGVIELMDYLKAEGYKIALATSTNTEFSVMLLQRSGLLSYFDYLSCGDMVKNVKPSPDIYLAACKNLGCKPEETYAIEDSYTGILSSSSAGLKTIMVPDILKPNKMATELCVAIVDDCRDIIDFLEKTKYNTK